MGLGGAEFRHQSLLMVTVNTVCFKTFNTVKLQSFSSSSFAFPALSLGFTIFGELFDMCPFYDPTIEVVTLHLFRQIAL